MPAIGVYKIEYETEKASWTACVGAYSSEEAIAYLTSKLGTIKITSIGHECRLDAITDPIRDIIVKNSMPSKKGPGRPVGSTKEEKK